MTLKKLAMAISLVLILTATTKATPITCDERGCSDWNIQVQSTKIKRTTKVAYEEGVRFLPHPKGCPARAFCACGAAVEVFGKAIRSLWPARAWFKFPSTPAAPGTVAVRSHHVFVLVRQIEGNQWLVRDYNSGGHKSREWVRSISGYKIVDPRRGMASL